VPGQEGRPEPYAGELKNITDALLTYTRAHPKTRLLYLTTTPELCSAASDATIANILNVNATAIMAAAGIPVIDPYTAIRTKCGGTLPTKGCQNEPTWG